MPSQSASDPKGAGISPNSDRARLTTPLRLTADEPLDPLAELRANRAGPAPTPTAPTLSERLAALAATGEAPPAGPTPPPRRSSLGAGLGAGQGAGIGGGRASTAPTPPQPQRRAGGASMFRTPEEIRPEPAPAPAPPQEPSPEAEEGPLLFSAPPRAPNRPKVFGFIAAGTVVIVLLNAATLQFLVKSKTAPAPPLNLRSALAWPNPLVPMPAKSVPVAQPAPPAPVAAEAVTPAPVQAPPPLLSPAPAAARAPNETAEAAPPEKASAARPAPAAKAAPPVAPPVLRPKLEADVPAGPAKTSAAAHHRSIDLSALAASKAAPAAAAAPATVGIGSAPALQIGAFASPAIAEEAWRKVQSLMPSEAESRRLSVEPVSVNGATLYRALVLGFKDRAEASSSCRRLQTKGVSCFVKK